MSIKENQSIKVLNYSNSAISVKASEREYWFNGATGEVPVVFFISFKDVEFIDSRTNVFVTGRLRFEESKQEEIFLALNRDNWKDTLLSEDMVNDLILNPIEENLKRILSIKDISTFERVRGKMIHFINTGKHDISNRVQTLIQDRFKELSRGILVSTLPITKGLLRNVKPESEEVKIIKSELEEMKAMVAQLLAEKEKVIEPVNTETITSEKPETIVEQKPKPGRPAKTK